MLFLDARPIFRVDRAHREFTPEQGEFLANIVRLYRLEQPELVEGSESKTMEVFPRACTGTFQGSVRWQVSPT